MPILKTQIIIAATPQTVWSILDNLPAYPGWNRLVPDLTGLTIVGETVRGTLIQPNTPDIPLAPVLTRIVGARELRWLTEAPEPGVFRAEHIFVLTPMADGSTRLDHDEIFEGAAVAEVWDGIAVNGRAAYEAFNRDLKARAEAFASETPMLHPALGTAAVAPETATLRCACASDPVTVALDAPIAHNHLCGCSQCWKPEGAVMAQIAVVPAGQGRVLTGADKLTIANPGQSVERHACRACGTHMIGRVADPRHHFFGLDFVHPERADRPMPAPEFAGFVSSLIETGTDPSRMQAIRAALAAAGIPAHDTFSPEIMDLIAWHRVKLHRHGETA